GHWRQLFGQVDAAFLDEGAKALEGAVRTGLESIVVETGLAVDFRLVAHRAPDRVRLQTDDRIAIAAVAAFDGFEKEAVWLSFSDLEHGGNGRIEIGDETRIDDLRLARVIRGFEGGEFGQDHCATSAPVT